MSALAVQQSATAVPVNPYGPTLVQPAVGTIGLACAVALGRRDDVRVGRVTLGAVIASPPMSIAVFVAGRLLTGAKVTVGDKVPIGPGG